MNQQDPESGTEEEAAVRRRPMFWPVLIAAVVLFTLLGIWTQRTPIADNLISRELMRRDVPARYDIARIGLRTQRLENLVLGPRDRPDLVADWVEVDVVVTTFSPRVTAVRAGGVRLRGRIVDGKLNLGELDKFRDPDSAAPLGLPDLDLTLQDARMRLDTPLGPVGMKLDGSGNLRSGFEGKLAAVMPRAEMAGCRAGELSLYADMSVTAGEPRLTGPLRADGLNCPEVPLAVVKPAAALDVRLNESMDQWRGRVDLTTDRLAAGPLQLAAAGGEIAFDGGAKGMEGRMKLSAASLAHPSVRSGRTGLEGSFSTGFDQPGDFARFQGEAETDGLKLWGPNPMSGLREAAAGTPFGPLAAKLADAIERAGRNNAAQATFALMQRGGGGRVQVTDLSFESASGARVGMTGRSGFAWSWPQDRLALDGSLRVEGGGLPDAAIRLKRDGNGRVSGQIFMRDYVAGNARLALSPVRFVAGRGGSSRFTTIVRLDGPLPGGGLRGLSLPVDGRLAPDGTVRINTECMPLSFAGLKYQSLALGRTRLRFCPANGGAMVRAGPGGFSFAAVSRAPRLQGRIGETPVALAADTVRLGIPDEGFSAGGLNVRLGTETPTLLEAARLTGQFSPAGLEGTLAGAGGHIGNVPLLMSEAEGRWRFANGKLVVDGGLRVADQAVPDRFNPLISKNFVLTLEDNHITAGGTLAEPRTGAPVTRVAIAHDLGTGAGHADLLVEGLRFDAALQPEDITRIALGVVANVDGVVTGQGRIRWDSAGVKSDGRFSTANMSLAAAFGPVTGLSGEIYFSDLLGLQTPSGQILRLGSVNAGVEATDGVVRYHLLPGQQVRIEGGTWPFSGGELTLEPTVLDFSAERPRYLTFRIIGLQAAEFINKLELENIAATGTFDGLLPMIFDNMGGRIVGGVLVARQHGLPPLYVDNVRALRVACDPDRQGGTLAYVGEVSNADLGMFGKLAFDALKSLRYKCLTILMDGDLGGEIVTQVAFNGVNQAPVGAEAMGLGRQLTGLPFIFNIRIEAPFRGLLNTARSFIDPGLAIRNYRNNGYQPVIENRLAVQPAESDNASKGTSE